MVVNNKELAVQKEALDKMRRDFVANVSHELRTPLTVVHGYLETLLRQATDDEDSKKFIFSQMYQQTLRMESIINDLLVLSSLETEDVYEKTHAVVNVPKLIDGIVDSAKTLSGKQNHHFYVTIDSNLDLLGDEKELHSAISNLIFNAVKYTPANGDIIVDWFADENHVYFRVRDTGIGIAEKHIVRLTERFYRVDKARSRESGGTGLGLAIVKHVLTRHGAELKIESQLGEGSVFTCIFDLAQSVKLGEKPC